MTKRVSGGDAFNQIRTIMTGPGRESARTEKAAEVLTEALGDTATTLGADAVAQLAVAKMKEEGVPVSQALQVAGQAFDLSPSSIRSRIAQLGDALVRHAIGTQVRDMSDTHGSTTLVMGDITDPTANADITIVPQKPSPNNKGGLVGAWRQYAASHGEVGDAISEAIKTYDTFAQRSPGSRLPPGYTLPVPTKLSSTEGPSHLLFATTIPSLEQHVQDRTPETRDNRMANLRDKTQRILIQLQQMSLMDPDLSAKDRIRVTLPILGTGPLGMVDHEECAAVMRELIPQFQEQNPQFEFAFMAKNVGDEADFADRINGFFEVFTGRRTDIPPPRLQDSSDNFRKAVDPFKAPLAKGGTTLTPDLVSEHLDPEWEGNWAQTFLSALENVPESALQDRAAGRAYFTGNDKETFSMLHKLVEFPQTRAAFLGQPHDAIADGVDRKGVSKSAIAQVLESPKIQVAVEAQLRASLPNVFGQAQAFGGADSLKEIVSAAVGSYLLTTLQEGHQAVENTIDDAIAHSEAEIIRLSDALGLSENAVRTLTNDATDLEAAIRQLNRDKSDLRTQVAELETQLGGLRTRRTARRTHATSYPSSSTGS